MISKDIFFQHKTLNDKIDLVLNPIDKDLNFNNNILNLYDNNEKQKVEIKASAKINNIKELLPKEFENDVNKFVELTLLLKSIKSIYRKSLTFYNENNIFKTSFVLDKLDWRGELSINAMLVLKKKINPIKQYASAKGSQLGWSQTYKVYFDEPEEKSSGEGIDVKWESFKSSKLYWLNKNYQKDVYTLDVKNSGKPPKLYLNDDIDNHLKTLLKLETKSSGMKSIIRDLMYQNISSTVFAQLLTDCLNDLDKLIKEEKNSSEKSIAIENAWDELKPWKQNMVKNYADRIIPDCRKKDALENLKEKLYENENYINELAKLTLNIAQNSLTETTEKIYTKAAIRLTEKK